KGTHPLPLGGGTEVMHHALAFDTLLSSQETNASTVVRNFYFRFPGRFHFVLLLCLYSFRFPFRRQIGVFPAV
ncbi:hypothetical protein ACFFOP_02985, partial [Sinosporangium siamense]|uniref:hypothetical protein n=1 Tax=Sinosporangium siamense TaxID=1367973 RepID=UPI0035EC78A1